MRKILFFISCIIAVNHSFGQTIKFDITAGVNRSVYSEKEGPYGKSIPGFTYSVSDSYITGYHVGLLATISHGDFDLQSGLVYMQMGGNDITTTSPIASVVSQEYGHLILNYINLPVNITYNFKIHGGKLFFGGGPYMETGIAGKYTSTYISTENNGTTTGSRSYGVGFGSSTTSPAFGINLMGGIHLNNSISFSAGYEFGLTNESFNPIFIAKNNAFTISASYTLFKKIIHHKTTTLKNG
jgi:hypothetical protein